MVISGRDKGLTGTVTQVVRSRNRVIVEGRNLVSSLHLFRDEVVSVSFPVEPFVVAWYTKSDMKTCLWNLDIPSGFQNFMICAYVELSFARISSSFPGLLVSILSSFERENWCSCHNYLEMLRLLVLYTNVGGDVTYGIKSIFEEEFEHLILCG